jgi:geranylgeranyl pyrophosphate synthase
MKEEKIPYEPLKIAIDYFMDSWEDVVHPALLSLACEAVGGNADVTTQVGAALVLLAGGADLHDDILDESLAKESKPTVFGKFGKDLTVLAGDALLFKGLYMLHQACDVLSKEQKESVLEFTKQAFFRMSSAEAKEISLRKRTDAADEYLEMIKMKSAVSKATMKIGAILGKGKSEEIELLGKFGRSFGILFTLRDEFIDVLDFKEFENRREKECLPLPIQLALKDPSVHGKISRLITKAPITKKDAEQLFDLVIDLKQNVELKEEMRAIVKSVRNEIKLVKLHQKSCLKLLLKSMMEDL